MCTRGDVRSVWIAVLVVLAAVSVSDCRGGGAGGTKATLPADLKYGFRHDPMKWVRNDKSWRGAQVRTFVFERPQPGDRDVLARETGACFKRAERGQAKGSPGDASDTFGWAHRVFELGCAPDDPRLAKLIDHAKEVIAEREGQPSESPFYAYRFLALAGEGKIPAVTAWLQPQADDPHQWIASGCQWGPVLHAEPLWAARDAVRGAEAAVEKALRWMADGTDQAGCLGFWDPWSFIHCADYVDLPVSAEVVAKMVPMLLRTQSSAGDWGFHTPCILSALKKHGLLEHLRKLPPLPPDWRIVRSIPTPAGSWGSMAWDGKSLWLHDREAKRAVAVSPEDGQVIGKVEIPTKEAWGLAWHRGCLVFQTDDPLRLLKVNTETGEASETAPIEKPIKLTHWATGVPILHALGTEEPAIWYCHWLLGPMRRRRTRELIEWGEKPFGGRYNGVAHDGKHLWALDSKGKRICIIEKAESAQETTDALEAAVERHRESVTAELARHHKAVADCNAALVREYESAIKRTKEKGAESQEEVRKLQDQLAAIKATVQANPEAPVWPADLSAFEGTWHITYDNGYTREYAIAGGGRVTFTGQVDPNGQTERLDFQGRILLRHPRPVLCFPADGKLEEPRITEDGRLVIRHWGLASRYLVGEPDCLGTGRRLDR